MKDFDTLSPLRMVKLIGLLILLVWPGSWLCEKSYGGQRSDVVSDRYGVLKVVRIAMVHALGGVNRQDAQVAIDLHWTKHLANVFPGLDSQFELLPDVEMAVQKIRAKQLHALSISIDHFLRLNKLVQIEPVFISSRIARPLESYLLLVKKNTAWQHLTSLSSKRLLTEKMAGPGIGRMWLETVLQDKGLPGAEIYFQEIASADKPARIILPVFFGQADACLVPESAYQTMVELNPQISQRLTILERSPGFVKTIHCVTDAMPSHMVKTFLKKGMRMDDTANGRQLLLIFHVKKNFAFKPSYLENSERIFERFHQLVNPPR